ncbi:MAG: PAS domain S-box protein, partial [Verrucomicrobia bacterium]|nr:PAS domain S-box protein [Verrucomicrobiota bacterium]
MSELAADLALALHGIELENQRRQAEARMRLLSQALESAANAIVITDREGRISWANPAFTQLTGYSLAEALGQKPSLLKSGLHDQTFYRALWETVLAGKVWSAVMINRRKDGTRYTEENTITPVRDERGEITHFIAVKQDITARQQAAEALRQHEEYFRALTEKATDITTVLNADGTFRYASPSVRQVLGYTPEELVGHEFRLRHKEGTWRALEATARNLLDDPNVAGVVVNSRDITERQQLEQQLRQAQKMEAVGQLAGGVAHDFNNMLAVVRGNAELLLMNADEHTSETTDCLKQITAASERATNLTRQLLAFSRKQVMQSQPLVLNDVIADVTKMLKRIIGEHIDLQCRCGAQLPFVQADAGMIEQVLVNLAVNARDAMPHGGQLLITTEPVTFEETPGPAHPEARAGQFACLAVSDTGTGIAPEHLLRIFEPFFTTKEPGKGTGLGLATVYGIVQQHQGWIEVFTQPGAGTTFKIFLPVVPPPPRTPAAARAETKVSGGVETILLVEDDYAMRMVTRRVLESQGYQIYEATTAREALEVWRSHAGEIALLLTDIVMPEGITGCDLTEQLRAQRPALKVVLMSGYSADVISQNSDFLQCTKSGFLQKPF